MKIITGKPVAVLFAAAHHESTEIGLVDRFVVREPGVAIDPEDAAFGFQTLVNGIELNDLINDGLDKCLKIAAGFIIALTVFAEPISVIMNFQI